MSATNTARHKNGWFQKTAAALLALVLMLVLAVGLFPVRTLAAGGLEMSTPYPGISAKPGDSPSFALTLENTSGAPLNAALSIASLPEGWSGYFGAGGNTVSRVYVGSGAETNTATVTFYLSIPAEAANGDYPISLLAEAGEGVASQLDLTLTLTEEAEGESSLTVQYPEQEGSAGTAFSFSATLVNNYATEQSYSLSAEAPAGWDVSFTPADGTSQVASITVEPQQSQGITISVKPPENAEAGDYAIACSAISANQTLGSDLAVTINEAYSLALSGANGVLSFDARANTETPVVLTLTNNSNMPLENVTLTSTAPTDWQVRFETAAVELLEAGATQEVTAYVTPSSNAMTGDYVTEITASNAYVSTTAQFRVSVKTSTLWGLVALLLIAVVVCGLVWVFRKYGRR